MKKNFQTILPVTLTLFDEGGAAGAAGGEAAGSTNVGSGSQQVAEGPKTVLYGKQDTQVDAGQQGEVADPQEKAKALKAQFENLIKGEYKDAFKERTQAIIDQRFKSSKQLEAQLQSIDPVLNSLYERYKVQPGDLQGLQKALDSDAAYLETAAEDMGLTVEQYQQYRRLERENEQFRRMQQEQESRQAAEKTYSGWLQQAELLKADYPEFDLAEEIENPKFIQLLQSNVDMKVAYEVLHIKDVKENTAKAAQKNLSQTIRTQGQRPPAAGTKSQSGVIIKSDVSKLTKADRQEIARRAARGERITF